MPDGWRVVGLDPAARVLCGAGASLTLEGYLGERLPAEDPIFSGEPDWLANEATLVLWSAVGPAVTGFELRLHIDPRSGVAYSDAILSDPEGSRATLVHVTGHLNDPASASCRRSPRIDNFLPMTETEQVMWCRQQFVVEQIHVGEFAEADLTDMETCENEALGYRVSFPDAWYTNTAYEGAPACGLFNPGVFAVAPGRPASGVAITVGGVPGAFGHLDPILSNQEVTVAGRPARRLEVGGGYGPAAASPAWARQYQYIVSLTDAWDGPKLIATTSNGGPGDYETNRAVLDAMMESLVLLPAD